MIQGGFVKRITIVSLLLAAGCGADSQNKEIPEPVFGAADSLQSVERQGPIELGTAVEQTFDEDLQFFGYEFLGSADGIVDVQITQRGSSRSLDTTMFVYGQTTRNWERVAFDDDDGWGKLSRIKDLSLASHSRYLVVVGTADGIGRGNFRLDVSCTNDRCNEFDPRLLETCDGAVEGWLTECVDGHDFGFDPHPSDVIDVVDGCADESQMLFDDVCGSSSDAWCFAGHDQFASTMLPVCVNDVRESFHIPETLDLRFVTLQNEASLDDYVSTVNSDCEACEVGYGVYSYDMPSAPPLDTIAETIRFRQEQPFEWRLIGAATTDRGAVTGMQDEAWGLWKEIDTELGGGEFELQRIGATIPVAAGADGYFQIWVLHYLESNTIVVIEDHSFET